jgi:hypothetical protein
MISFTSTRHQGRSFLFRVGQFQEEMITVIFDCISSIVDRPKTTKHEDGVGAGNRLAEFLSFVEKRVFGFEQTRHSKSNYGYRTNGA